MKLFHCLAIGLTGLFIGACGPMSINAERGSGRVVAEDRTIRGVDAVTLNTSGKLFIEKGEVESLRIEADDDLLPYLQTFVQGGMLTIQSRRPAHLHSLQPSRYYLTVKNLNTINIFSSGDVDAPDLEAEKFSITVSSSGDLRMGNLKTGLLKVDLNSSGDVFMGLLTADRLEATLNSSGDLRISGGSVEKQNVSLSSSGDYSAQDLDSGEAAISLNSSGDGSIRVRDRLDANLNSSGDLHYRGNPSLNLNRNSSGNIIRTGD